MRKQRLCGLVLILISILIFVMAWHGTTIEERDITPVLFLLPLGLFALFSKTNIMIDSSKTARKDNRER